MTDPRFLKLGKYDQELLLERAAILAADDIENPDQLALEQMIEANEDSQHERAF